MGSTSALRSTQSNPMRTLAKFSLVLTTICLFTSPSSAQENTWQVILLSGDMLHSCTLDSLPDVVLFARCNGESISLPVDSIASLSRLHEGGFWKGAGTGFLVGAASGAILGAILYHKPTGPYTFDFGPGVAALGGALLDRVMLTVTENKKAAPAGRNSSNEVCIVQQT